MPRKSEDCCWPAAPTRSAQLPDLWRKPMLPAAARHVAIIPQLLASVAVLLAAAPVHAAPQAEQSTERLAPVSGAWFGAFVNPNRNDPGGSKPEVLALETDLGRKLAITNRFYRWEVRIPTPLEQWDVANGRIPMISWGVNDTRVITSGSQDGWIRSQANRLEALGAPFFLRFYWEMDGDYRRSLVHSPADIFVQEGATNAVWVWCPTSWKFVTRNPWPPAYYPGHAYVDWVAADGYNWNPAKPGSVWRSFTGIFQKFYDWAATTNKPIMIAEYAAQERSPGEKAAWITNSRDVIKTRFPLIRAVVWFDTRITKGNLVFDWRIRTSAASFAAYKAMGGDPYFRPPR
jgi:hypothetical protein